MTDKNPQVGKLEEGFFLRFSSEELVRVRTWIENLGCDDLKSAVIKASTSKAASGNPLDDIKSRIFQAATDVDTIRSIVSTISKIK